MRSKAYHVTHIHFCLTKMSKATCVGVYPADAKAVVFRPLAGRCDMAVMNLSLSKLWSRLRSSTPERAQEGVSLDILCTCKYGTRASKPSVNFP